MESWRCLDCDFVGILEKGGCGKCGSKATISEDVVRIKDLEYEVFNTGKEREWLCPSVQLANPLRVSVHTKSQLTMLLILLCRSIRIAFCSMRSGKER